MIRRSGGAGFSQRHDTNRVSPGQREFGQALAVQGVGGRVEQELGTPRPGVWGSSWRYRNVIVTRLVTTRPPAGASSQRSLCSLDDGSMAAAARLDVPVP